MTARVTDLKTQAFVGGEWRDGTRRFLVDNPATLEPVAEVVAASRSDAKEAIEVAARVMPAWAAMPAPARAAILRNASHRMLERSDELARLVTLEGGKPLAEAKGEVNYAASFFSWFAGEAERVYGRVVPASSMTKRLFVLKQPVGVVAAITPWNFPVAMPARKLAPALAAGCAIVLKPAEQTPLSALLMAEILEEAGLPPGVLSVLPVDDPREVGAEFLEHPLVRKITFTGSTSVGKFLAREAAAQVKRVSLELGGHAPLIVFADADLELAARGALESKFRNAGQTCVCANRLYVAREVLGEFLERFSSLVSTLHVGNGLEPGVQIGPLIDDAGLAKVEEHVHEAVAAGAQVLVGGERSKQQGRFYQPTVLSQVTDEMRLMREETFGPVAPVLAFDSEEEVLLRANAGPFGLAAYCFTKDLSRAWRVAEALEYGIVGLNDGLPSTAQAPFGGFKESGLGREGGSEGIEAFLETKYVSVGL